MVEICTRSCAEGSWLGTTWASSCRYFECGEEFNGGVHADVTRSSVRESSLSPRISRISRSIGVHGPARGHHTSVTASLPSSSARIFMYSSLAFFVTLFRTA